MEVGYLNLNAVYPTAEHSLTQGLSKPVYDETAVLEARYTPSPRVGADGGVGLRLWSNWRSVWA